MEDVSPTSTSQEFESPNSKQHRKSISTGGGRAWSQEEENYLIETRMHKMPYKHIATTLKKTELACRLHYHQLSFGNRRRRRTSSVTSLTSYAPSPITPAETPTKRDLPPPPQQQQQQQPLPSLSSITSPDLPQKELHHHQHQHQTPIPILPKPISTSSSSSRPAPRGLRLITSDIDRYEKKKPHVDIPRLDKIYDAHRLHFWSMIARSYGNNLSPAALEEAWCRAHNIDYANLPPTPTASPDGESGKLASISSSSSLSASSGAVLGAPFSAVAEYSRGFTAVNGTPRSAVV
ncbi:MAG: hypothetical protein Q9219_005418, partial [cf. Caloplaca sp. 3 TL-2023]